ncbi:MAG TPA: queuosine salvage family protein [Acidobacteriota bacterium]
MLDRRHFIAALAASAVGGRGTKGAADQAPATQTAPPGAAAAAALPLPPADHPILGSLTPVIAGARHVRLHPEQVEQTAGWMAYEGLPWPDFRSPLYPEGNDADTLDYIFLTATINFAFTDFERRVMFQTEYGGAVHSDSEAMDACLKRAYDQGLPILEGRYLAAITRAELDRIFAGNITIPMLDQRLEIFHQVGRRLEQDYGGRFHRFVAAGPPRLYAAGGQGLLERLLDQFPSFRDTSDYRGHRVLFQKRAQLLWWNLHARFRSTGFFALADPERLTIFADYIVPVAFRLLGITSYSDALEQAINRGRIIPAQSEEEIEIRAFTLWAAELLTQAINRRRPADRQLISPVVDGRLWTHYHTTHWPHHLTVTTAY